MKACIDPSGKLLYLWNAKTIETVHDEQLQNMFDYSACTYELSSPSTKEPHTYAKRQLNKTIISY